MQCVRYVVHIICYDSFMLTNAGLYYKLHGVHRPVAMKKSVIKRRKRVVPAPQGSQAAGYETGNVSADSSEPEGPPPAVVRIDERGTVNADGSVNLGFRPRNTANSTQEVVEPHAHENQVQTATTSTPVPATVPNQPKNPQDISFINHENTLPPMNSYPSPNLRPPSLSPNFLSPNRKRSFSAADSESGPPPAPESNAKRLSSIKSILNPTQGNENETDSLDPTLRTVPSPETRYATAAIPSHPSNTSPKLWDTPSMQQPRPSEQDRLRIERRAELQREAERMREALRAKERELEELNS
jgi:GATA-binding protein